MPKAIINIRYTLPDLGFVYFTRWLPSSPSDIVFSNLGKLEFALILSENSLAHGGLHSDIPIEKHLNLFVEYLDVRITVRDVNQALADFILKGPREQIRSEDTELRQELYEFQKQVFDFCVTNLNRVIDYFRVIFQHYWLENIAIGHNSMGSFFHHAPASIEIEEGTSRFFPTMNEPIIATVSDGKEYIRQEDWEGVKAYVNGTQRTSLLGAILSNAKQLRSRGYRRNALVEAVTALEFALSGFCDATKETPPEEALSKRVETQSLGRLIETLGLRGAFSVAIPLIFEEDRLPASILSSCRKAIDIRNSIMHAGQRDVRDDHLAKMLKDIEFCCFVFGENWDSTAKRFCSVPAVGIAAKLNDEKP